MVTSSAQGILLGSPALQCRSRQFKVLYQRCCDCAGLRAGASGRCTSRVLCHEANAGPQCKPKGRVLHNSQVPVSPATKMSVLWLFCQFKHYSVLGTTARQHYGAYLEQGTFFAVCPQGSSTVSSRAVHAVHGSQHSLLQAWRSRAHSLPHGFRHLVCRTTVSTVNRGRRTCHLACGIS
jgi:hypothetical protein